MKRFSRSEIKWAILLCSEKSKRSTETACEVRDVTGVVWIMSLKPTGVLVSNDVSAAMRRSHNVSASAWPWRRGSVVTSSSQVRVHAQCDCECIVDTLVTAWRTRSRPNIVFDLTKSRNAVSSVTGFSCVGNSRVMQDNFREWHWNVLPALH